MKTIYFIRHGIAQHNVLFNNLGKKVFYDPRYSDTKLTPQGHEQSIKLGNNWKEIHDIDIALCSSLSRTLETAENIFMNTGKKIIALDILKEFPQGLQTCNKRSNKSDLIKRFHTIDFSYIDSEEDELWDSTKEESINNLNLRIEKLNDFLKLREEKNIAIIGHNSFISQYKDKKIPLIENGDQELLHCYPYKFQFNTHEYSPPL